MSSPPDPNRHYGVRRGSKRSRYREIPVTQDTYRTSYDIQNAHDKLEDARKRVISSIVRFIKVAGLQPGDPVPEEIRVRRETLTEIDEEMRRLEDNYPWLEKR